jgi:TFIIIC subunit triple barrel domain
VDLDLSSLNGVIRPRLQSRKKLIPTTTTKTANPAATPAASSPTPTPASAGTATGNATQRGANNDVQPNTPAAPRGTLLEAPAPGTEIQVLELGSHNPVISYQNEIYSCTWSDMIGTNMFFSEHDEEMEADPLRSAEDYDLLGISRVKLIGRKAKLADKPGRKETCRNAGNDLHDEEMDVTSGRGFGTIRASNPVINREVKKQAKFLENLMDAKRAKGQTDNVRTVYKPSRAPHEGAGNGPTVRGEQALSQEIEELNRRVVRGDADALRRLQIIYSEPDEQQSNDSIPQASAPTPGSTWHGSVDRENSKPYQTENA